MSESPNIHGLDISASACTVLDLFSGIGGMQLALQPWYRPLCYCEIDPFCQSVLQQRMQDGQIQSAPIWDDVRTLSKDILAKQLQQTPSSVRVDLISAGFPCQDISTVGHQKGLEKGERSSLFFDVLRLIDEFEPSIVFLENVANICNEGLQTIAKEISSRGYDMRWEIISAESLGAPHHRKRWFSIASKREPRVNPEHAATDHAQNPSGGAVAAMGHAPLQHGVMGWEPHVDGAHKDRLKLANNVRSIYDRQWACGEPSVDRMVDGIPKKLHLGRLKALGNSVVPAQARAAFLYLLTGELWWKKNLS
jgi:DNA-cytosine methyltransferase